MRGQEEKWIKLNFMKQTERWKWKQQRLLRWLMSCWDEMTICSVNADYKNKSWWEYKGDIWCRRGKRFKIHVFCRDADWRRASRSAPSSSFSAVKHNHMDVQRVCGKSASSCDISWAGTWPLLLGAGDNPLDEAALHQRFPCDSRFLPLGALRLSRRVRIFTISIRQETAIHSLLIPLRKRRKTLFSIGRRKRRIKSTWGGFSCPGVSSEELDVLENELHGKKRGQGFLLCFICVDSSSSFSVLWAALGKANFSPLVSN